MFHLFYPIFIIYEEFLYRYLTGLSITSITINSLFYIVSIGFLFSLIVYILPNKIAKYISPLLTLIICLWYGFCVVIYNTYGIVLSISATSLFDQITTGGFFSLMIEVIIANLRDIILILSPFIVSIIISKFLNRKFSLKVVFNKIVIIIVSFVLFICSLFIFNSKDVKDLYFKQHNNTTNVMMFGVLPSLFIDIRKSLTNFKEDIIIEIIEEIDPELIEEEAKPHISDVDFDELLENETNKDLINLHNIIKAETPTYTNEYTGLFEGKNLIYIMGETFNGFGVSEKLTPTLYKLINEGLYFSNFYSPTNLSTIGGEFSELTGLVPNLSRLTWDWREGKGYANYYPYGLGNLFNELGYKTYAYHNHDYTFQDRNLYLKALGFNNYEGCGNGMEERGLACYLSDKTFPESDDDMINLTYEDYINDDKFMVYYATVSGHMYWGFYDNAMAKKHQDEVKDLPYSEAINAFIAAQKELDLALQDLLQVLEENNKLDDTVIVLAADHHPYGLEYDEMVELASVTGQTIDEVFEMYRNNLIIYTPGLEHTEIDKPCSTIDVLPTTLNLFNIDYDSRLIVGKDILSASDGLVIFADNSWISNEGRYNANRNLFIKNEDSQIDEDAYFSSINNLVRNRIFTSTKIMEYDYYKLLFYPN